MSYNTPWNGYQQHSTFGEQYAATPPYYRQYPQQLARQQPLGLNGMIVQSVDSITADAVPMDGSVAFFPKQDMSEIYVKSWNPDGTIKTVTFRPIEESLPNTVSIEAQVDELVAKVNELEASINKIQNGKRNYNRKESSQS